MNILVNKITQNVIKYTQLSFGMLEPRGTE